jgi:hypothetical protein
LRKSERRRDAEETAVNLSVCAFAGKLLFGILQLSRAKVLIRLGKSLFLGSGIGNDARKAPHHKPR